MMNPKNICICSCVGFCLSFFIGLFSGDIGFGHMLFRALISAVLFGGLYIGINFVYEKFLSDVSSVSESVDSESVSQPPAAGNLINIVVEDSKLQDEDEAPKFSVGNNRPNLGAESLLDKGKAESFQKVEETSGQPSPNILPSVESPSTASSVVEVAKVAAVSPAISASVAEKNVPVEEASPDTDSFKPVALGEMTKSESPVPASEVSASDGGDGGSVADAEDLDNLPDIGNINLSESSPNSEVIKDSEFALGGSSSSSGDKSGGQDTNTMAMAIRTILAKDN